MFNQSNRLISHKGADKPSMTEKFIQPMYTVLPTFVTAVPNHELHERLLASADKSSDSNVTEPLYPNSTFIVGRGNHNRSVNQSALGTEYKSLESPASETWQNNRRWLGIIFATWFLIAFGLLINAIYVI